MEKVNELALVLAQVSVEYAAADIELSRLRNSGLTKEDSAYQYANSAVRIARDKMYDAQNAMYLAAWEVANNG